MNRRRTAHSPLRFGSVLLLVGALMVSASAGVFYAYVKNRQINLQRDIQRAEERVSQHEIDIKATRMGLTHLLNPILLHNRLRDLNSDLRDIPDQAITELDPRWRGDAAPAGRPAIAGPPPDARPNVTVPADSAMAGLTRSGP